MDLYQNYLEAISQFHAWSYFAKTGFVACDNDDAVCGHVLITDQVQKYVFSIAYACIRLKSPKQSHKRHQKMQILTTP